MNPAVTFGFLMMGKMEPPIAASYIIAQLIGAVVGCLPLLVWGAMGHSISFGATTPGYGYSVWIALLGEILTTFCLASTLYIFIAYRRLRRFYPSGYFCTPSWCRWKLLYRAQARIPQRTFGPAVISGQWDAWWICWVGPLAGAKPSRTASSVTSGNYFGPI